MADAEGVGRVGLAVWTHEIGHSIWDAPPVLGMVGDECLIEIDDGNRERVILDLVAKYEVDAPDLRIEAAFFGYVGGFFASPMDFLGHWPGSAAAVPADVFIDPHYKAAFTAEGDAIVVSVRHALRPSGPPKRQLRFHPKQYEDAISHLAQQSRRLREELISAAQQRAPQKVAALQKAFERWPA